ncbi:MAG: diversity-generating retroelement protein Avd [Oculatellaceae cyanobacterium Prado106]|jgi:hypothetical protein|nr:diversity-generating retroelement protein Avd [Oculatellaceae cyanobacterium Prado106]
MAYDLPIIQKTYGFTKWYLPILNRLPRAYKFTLGDRITTILYELLEGFITARYTSSEKHQLLQRLNAKLDILRYQTRLLFDLELIKCDRYEYSSKIIEVCLGLTLRDPRVNKIPVSGRDGFATPFNNRDYVFYT